MQAVQPPRNIRIQLILSYVNICLQIFHWLSACDDEEELEIVLAIERRRKRRRTIPLHQFSLDRLDWSEDKQVLNLRFTISEIQRFINAANLPHFIKLNNNVKIPSLLGIAILLRKLAFPVRLADLEGKFNIDPSIISRIINTTIYMLMEKFASFLELWPGVDSSYVLRCERAITLASENTVHSIWAWIDGTVRRVTRPTHDQRLSFSGYKRYHAQKYQAVMSPDGLIVSLFGPFIGIQHDSTMLRESALIEKIRAVVSYRQYQQSRSVSVR
jgi:hypothetical protein